jgi:hypothetical protein
VRPFVREAVKYRLVVETGSLQSLTKNKRIQVRSVRAGLSIKLCCILLVVCFLHFRFSQDRFSVYSLAASGGLYNNT